MKAYVVSQWIDISRGTDYIVNIVHTKHVLPNFNVGCKNGGYHKFIGISWDNVTKFTT